MTPTISPRKIEANRANALHSTGPRTEAGKSAASRNAITHGLASRAALLPSEDADHYSAHRESYYNIFRPTNGIQLELVEELASIEWRLRRVPTFEAQLLNLEIECLEANHEDEPQWVFVNGDECRIAALAFKRLAQSGVLPNLHRLEARLTRRADRVHKMLHSLCAAAGPAAQQPNDQALPVEPQEEIASIENRKIEPTTAASTTPIRLVHKIGRNESCPCGSGLKFKRCCIGKAHASPSAAAA